MIGIGVIREDLVGIKEIHDRYIRIIEKAAARDDAELTHVVTYSMETIELLLAVLANANDDVTAYTPGHIHVGGAEKAILRHANLVCVLDGVSWPRRVGVSA